MALRPCRDCSAEISNRAKVCPHCGLKKPHQHPISRSFNSFATGLIVLGLLLILVLMLGFCILSVAS